MKLGPKTKLGKRIKTRSRNFDDDVMYKTVTSLPFFQFVANAYAFPDAWSGKRMSSSTVTYYPTKTEN